MALPIYSNLVVKADPANLAQVQFELKKAFSNNFLTVDIAQKGGFDDFKKAIAATNQQAKGLVGTLQDVGIQVSTVTRRFSAYFIASGAILSSVVAFKSVIGEAIKFQDELIKIKQVSGDADSQVRKLGDTIGNLAKQYGVSSGELIKSATVLRQAGLNTKEVTLAIQALAKTDLAPNFDSIAKTTEGVIAIFQQFGRDAGKLEGQLGALNAVAGEFATEASDLITLVQKAGGAAKSSGANLEELVALFTSVRATTRESADAIATGLRTIFGRLQRPDTLKFLDDLGIKLRYTAQEAANLGNADLAGKFIGPFEAIQKIAAGTKGLGQGSTLFSNIVEQIGGLRQLSRVVPLLEETTTLIEAYNVALAGKTSLEAQALIKQDSYLNQLTKIKEEFLAIGRALVESEGFGRFAQTLQTAAQAAISLVNALAPILPYLGVIIGGNILGGAIRGFGQGIFASSGIGNYNVPPPPRRHASGGIIPGPSDGDKYPALLEGGEAVIPAKSVRKYAAIIPGLISGKLPGYSKGYVPQGAEGWKLHLNVEEEQAKAIEKYLKEKGILSKIGRDGGQEGKGMTVYAGHADRAKEIAEDISKKYGKVLGSPVGDALKDDKVLAKNVMGRFDIGSVDKDFHQYGKKGIPILNDDANNNLFGKQKISESQLSAADKILRERYGDFYSGSKKAGVGFDPKIVGGTEEQKKIFYKIYKEIVAQSGLKESTLAPKRIIITDKFARNDENRTRDIAGQYSASKDILRISPRLLDETQFSKGAAKEILGHELAHKLDKELGQRSESISKAQQQAFLAKDPIYQKALTAGDQAKLDYLAKPKEIFARAFGNYGLGQGENIVESLKKFGVSQKELSNITPKKPLSGITKALSDLAAGVGQSSPTSSPQLTKFDVFANKVAAGLQSTFYDKPKDFISGLFGGREPKVPDVKIPIPSSSFGRKVGYFSDRFNESLNRGYNATLGRLPFLDKVDVPDRSPIRIPGISSPIDNTPIRLGKDRGAGVYDRLVSKELYRPDLDSLKTRASGLKSLVADLEKGKFEGSRYNLTGASFRPEFSSLGANAQAYIQNQKDYESKLKGYRSSLTEVRRDIRGYQPPTNFIGQLNANANAYNDLQKGYLPPPPGGVTGGQYGLLGGSHLQNVINQRGIGGVGGIGGGGGGGGGPPNNPPPNGPNPPNGPGGGGPPNNPPPNGPNPPNGPGGGTTKESVFKRLQQSNRFNQLSSLAGIGLPIGLAVASQNSDDFETSRGFSNAALGSSIGSTLGSALPIPGGTAIGSAIGALAGYFLGVKQAAEDLKKKAINSRLDDSIKGLGEAITNVAEGSGSISDLTENLERVKRASLEKAIFDTKDKSSAEFVKASSDEFKKSAGVLAPSFQKVLQEEAKKQGKSGQTKTFDDTNEDIKKLINNIAVLRGVSSGTIKKEVGKVFDASKADEDRRKADTRFNVEINKSIASATQFSDAVTRAAEEVKNLDEKLKVITGGGYRPASFDVGKFGSVDKDVLGRLSGLGGGAFSQVTDQVSAVSDISKFLPEVLSRVVKPGEQTTDFLSGEFESQFKKIGEQTGKQFDTKVIRIMADKLGSLKSDELFENFKKDPEKFAKEFEHQFEPMLRAAQSIGKSLEERDKAYQDGLRHLLEINSKLNDLSERKNAITTEGLIARREFLSENAGINPSRISNSDIVFGQFNKEQDRLLGQSGIGENASAIAGLIDSLKEEQKILQEKAKVEANSIEGSTKFRDELYNTEKKLADANRALERLANTSERLAALQKDLAILQATREAKLGLTKSLITATPAELLQKQYDALAARLLIQNGGYNTRKYFDRIGASRGDPNLGANVTRQGYDTLENQYGDVELSSRFDEVIKDNKGKVIGRKKKTGKEISKLLQEEDNARAEGALNAQKEKEKILKVQQKALEVRKGAGADIVAGIIGAGAGANLGKLGAVDVMRINLEKTATSFSQVLKENNAAFFTKIDQYIAELQNNALSSQLAAKEVEASELEPTVKAIGTLPEGTDLDKFSKLIPKIKDAKEAKEKINQSDNEIDSISKGISEIINNNQGEIPTNLITKIEEAYPQLAQASKSRLLNVFKSGKETNGIFSPDAVKGFIGETQKAEAQRKYDKAAEGLPDKSYIDLPEETLDAISTGKNLKTAKLRSAKARAEIEELQKQLFLKRTFVGPQIPKELLDERNSPVLEPGRIGVAPNPIPKNIPPVILGDEKVPQKPQTIDEIRKPFLDSLGPVPEGFRRTSEGDLVPEFKAILPKPSPPPQGINLPQFLGVGINAPVGIDANANVGDDLVGSFERANKIFTDFTTNFGKQIEALANIPRVIDMNINQRVEVIINGAQVLANLEPSMKKIAEGAVSRAIEVIGGQLRENNISIKYNPSAQVSNAREQSVGNNPLYEGGEGL